MTNSTLDSSTALYRQASLTDTPYVLGFFVFKTRVGLKDGEKLCIAICQESELDTVATLANVGDDNKIRQRTSLKMTKRT